VTENARGIEYTSFGWEYPFNQALYAENKEISIHIFPIQLPQFEAEAEAHLSLLHWVSIIIQSRNVISTHVLRKVVYMMLRMNQQ
jgi:hypothetical protein